MPSPEQSSVSDTQCPVVFAVRGDLHRAGALAKHACLNAVLLMLVAAAGLIFFWMLMPETQEKANKANAGPQGQSAGPPA